MLPLPLLSVLTTRIRPTSSVRRTCVPPSACLSSPTMSTTRISGHRLGDEAHLGADQVLVPERRRREAGRPPRTGRAAASSALTSSSMRGPKPSGQRIELEVHPCRQWFHVAAGDRNSPFVPDHAAQHVQGRVGAHRARGGGPSRSRRARRPRRRAGRHRPRGCATRASPSLRTSTTARPASIAGVVGLPAAGRVEDGAIEGDGAVAPVHDHGVHLAQVGVAEVQQLGGHAAILPTPPRGHRPPGRPYAPLVPRLTCRSPRL